ncbi:MAG: hypothetical protein KAQ85_02330 [Thermodesulfovibrionia bacterium]|nr:hypothetical protein [Thermodesulfovibrionia bacterium]
MCHLCRKVEKLVHMNFTLSEEVFDLKSELSESHAFLESMHPELYAKYRDGVEDRYKSRVEDKDGERNKHNQGFVDSLKDMHKDTEGDIFPSLKVLDCPKSSKEFNTEYQRDVKSEDIKHMQKGPVKFKDLDVPDSIKKLVEDGIRTKLKEAGITQEDISDEVVEVSSVRV